MINEKLEKIIDAEIENATQTAFKKAGFGIYCLDFCIFGETHLGEVDLKFPLTKVFADFRAHEIAALEDSELKALIRILDKTIRAVKVELARPGRNDPDEVADE